MKTRYLPAQTEAYAGAAGFCGEEGLEEEINTLFRYAASVVLDFDEGVSFGYGDSQFDIGVVYVGDSIDRISKEVGNDLPQQSGICFDLHVVGDDI